MDSGTIRNYISPAVVKRMGLPYRQKRELYPLVMISGDPISYRDGMIHFETGPVKVTIKKWKIVISFDVLPLGKDEAVLGILFL